VNNFIYLLKCIREGCTLYLSNLKENPQEYHVIKITKLNGKPIVVAVENELRLALKCDHMNITKVEQAYAHNGSVWIASKYCKLGSLTDLILRYEYLNEFQIAFIAKQILSALQYMHEECHILHLDIKSDNILLTEEYQTLITDFGVSQQLEHKDATFDEMRGTPYWMAPEVIGEHVEFSSKADIWSFGIVLWELMNQGIPPWFIQEPLEALLSIKNKPIPPLPNTQQWSPYLLDLISKALCKDVSQRWNAKQLLEHDFFTVSCLCEDYQIIFPNVPKQ
jgi:serine/threonine protein kinase